VGLWGYSVQGAPMMSMEIVNTSRKLANGTRVTAHSLSFTTAQQTAKLALPSGNCPS
jgi:hypothetical protein